MNSSKKVIVVSQYLLSDPPTRNAVESLSRFFDVFYVQQEPFKEKQTTAAKLIKIKKFAGSSWIYKVLNLLYYSFKINGIIKKEKPAIVIAIMFLPIALIRKKNFLLVSAILDIPHLKFAGILDRKVISSGLKKMPASDIIWASDLWRGLFIKQTCKLRYLPLVCHNAPALNYFENIDNDNKWLRKELHSAGCKIDDKTCVLLRAGAIGEFGGIEETISAISRLSENVIFLLMGRPNKVFKAKLLDLIKGFNVMDRVILWDQPDDEIWKKTLLGSDIGHLIHIRPHNNKVAATAYDLNSSLSNNRLFQYMAAGLPIISYNDPRLDLIHDEVKCFEIVDVSDLHTNIRQAIITLYNDLQLRRVKGANAKSAFQNKYNWEFQFSKVIEGIK